MVEILVGLLVSHFHLLWVGQRTGAAAFSRTGPSRHGIWPKLVKTQEGILFCRIRKSCVTRTQ